MANRKRVKAIAISFFLVVAILVNLFNYSGILDIRYSPWAYGFIVDPALVDLPVRSVTHEFVQEAHSRSQIYVIWASIFATFWDDYLWRLIPGVLFVIAIVPALLPAGMEQRLKLALAGAAALGPLPMYGYYLKFSRTTTSIAIFLIFVFLITRMSDNKHQKTYYILITMATSSLIWFTHYSFWPLFATFVILLSISLDGFRRLSVLPAIALPFIINPSTGEIYIFSLLFLRELRNDFSLSILFNRGEGLPPDPMYIEGYNPTTHAWMPEVQYLLFVALLILVGVIYLTTILARHDEYRSYLTQSDVRITYALGLSAILYALLLIVRGYIYRATILWPIVVIVVSTELYRIGQQKSFNFPRFSLASNHLVVLFAVLVICIGVLPMFFPTLFDVNQDVNVPNDQQQASTNFEYTEGLIYTDLTHGSLLMLNGEDRVIVGTSTGVGDQIAIDRQLQVLYGNWDGHAEYILVTTNGSVGVRTWGSGIPVINESRYGCEHESIYDNGNDRWYIENQCTIT